VGNVVAQPKATPQVVATVADRAISENAFRMRYVDYLLKTGMQDNPRLRQSMLENLVTSELIIKAAEVKGIKQTPAYKAQEYEAMRKMSVELYVAKVLNPQIRISDADLADMFIRMNTTLRARHLYAPTKAKAEALYARVKRGETFEKLAKEVFTDTTLARTGGDLGAFSFDEMDPNFEDAAYKLKVNEISAPVRTAQGFSIIQLTERFTKPLITEGEFATKKDQVATFVRIRKQRQLRIQHVEELATALNIAYNANGMNRLLANLKGQVPIRGNERPDAWLKAPVCSFGVGTARKTWTVEQFRQEALVNASQKQLSQIKDMDALKSLIKGLLVQEEMVQRAQVLNLTDLPEFDDAVQINLGDWVIAEEMSQMNKAIVIPEDSLKAAFARDKDQIKSDEKVFVTEILVDDLLRAQALKAQATLANFEALASQYSQRPHAQEAGGKLGFVTRREMGALAEQVFSASKDQIIGPIEVKGKYVVFRIGEHLPSLPLSYEQAKPHLEQQLWQQYADAYMRRYRDQLQQQYGSQIKLNTALVGSMKLVN
jgi:parvulin-like peptidyl-prolyl isomerase